jgi:hypothetical protein
VAAFLSNFNRPYKGQLLFCSFDLAGDFQQILVSWPVRVIILLCFRTVFTIKFLKSTLVATLLACMLTVWTAARNGCIRHSFLVVWYPFKPGVLVWADRYFSPDWTWWAALLQKIVFQCAIAFHKPGSSCSLLIFTYSRLNGNKPVSRSRKSVKSNFVLIICTPQTRSTGLKCALEAIVFCLWFLIYLRTFYNLKVGILLLFIEHPESNPPPGFSLSFFTIPQTCSGEWSLSL